VSADVDTVILSWNDGDLLDTAVTSALASAGVTVQVIVVDNGSLVTPTVPPGVRLLRNDVNRGVAAGRNQGVRAGSAPFVLLLDSDARLEPDALAALLVPLRRDPGVGMTVPVMSGQEPSASAGAAPTVSRKLARFAGLASNYATASPDGSGSWDVDFGIGACQLFRRVAYEGVGGMDETYFYGPEDVDFCLRLRAQGWRVLQVAGAHVDHPARRRFRNPLSRRGLAHAWAVVRFLWRHRRFGGGRPIIPRAGGGTARRRTAVARDGRATCVRPAVGTGGAGRARH
jgi:GT2 family glycosyltransferase